MNVIIGAVTEGIKDTVICIPILYATYLFMEILEGSSKLNEETLCRYSRKVGPVIGGILGVIPQCGLAGSAAALYSTGTVTLGTMLAVFFATSGGSGIGKSKEKLQPYVNGAEILDAVRVADIEELKAWTESL